MDLIHFRSTRLRFCHTLSVNSPVLKAKAALDHGIKILFQRSAAQKEGSPGAFLYPLVSRQCPLIYVRRQIIRRHPENVSHLPSPCTFVEQTFTGSANITDQAGFLAYGSVLLCAFSCNRTMAYWQNRSPFTVTGSPGILTRFSFTRLRKAGT